MEISGQYLTYDEYKSLGGTLDKNAFCLLEYEARKKTDKRTLNRLINLPKDQIPQEVKLCIYKIITVLSSYDGYMTQNKAVASESVGSYSVSYGTPTKEYINVKNSEINDIINDSLFGVVVNNEHILYLGVA